MSANMVFGLFCIVIALVVAGMAWRMLQADKENARLSGLSGEWPTAPGQILSIRIEDRITDESSSYEPKIEYTYRVADQDYTGTRIAFKHVVFALKKTAQAVIAPYSVGPTIVAYEPAAPQNSVLDRTARAPRVSFWTVFLFLIAPFVAIAGVVMLSLPA